MGHGSGKVDAHESEGGIPADPGVGGLEGERPDLEGPVAGGEGVDDASMLALREHRAAPGAGSLGVEHESVVGGEGVETEPVPPRPHLLPPSAHRGDEEARRTDAHQAEEAESEDEVRERAARAHGQHRDGHRGGCEQSERDDETHDGVDHESAERTARRRSEPRVEASAEAAQLHGVGFGAQPPRLETERARTPHSPHA